MEDDQGRWYVPATGDGQRCVMVMVRACYGGWTTLCYGRWYVPATGMDNAVLW